MLRKMRNRQNLSIVPIVGILSFCLFVSSGCEPLRKKFKRNKSKSKVSSEFVPILEPVDYASDVNIAKEKYQYYYGVWRLWFKELYQGLDKDQRTRLVYSAQMMVESLQKLRLYTPEIKQTQLDQDISEALKILKKVDVADMMRSAGIIQRDLRDHEKSVRNNFKPEIIYGSGL